MAGGAYHMKNGIVGFAGAGAGLNHRFGTPDWRLLLGLRLGECRAGNPNRDEGSDSAHEASRAHHRTPTISTDCSVP